MYGWRGIGATPSPAIASIIAADAAKYNLDPALLTAVINQESAFNPNAVSSKGAPTAENAPTPSQGVRF